jgi:hypothetical protein
MIDVTCKDGNGARVRDHSAGIRNAYLQAADVTVGLLADADVAAAWDRPSALRHYRVSGLAGHLAGQVFMIQRAVGQPEPAEPRISLLDYYARAAWMNAGDDEEPHISIREGSAANAVAGPRALAERAAAAVGELRQALPGIAPGRLFAHPSWHGFCVSFDDFVLSRLMELLVHCDDLAVSAGIASPEQPHAAAELVIDLLSRLAVRRHGATAVLRTLSRPERAPGTITAFG